ncbi:MAG: protein translocase subunit SecF, partial [Rhodospirillales bacterium]
MIFGFNLVPAGVNVRFISRRLAFFVFSGLLVAASVALVTIKGLSYGIDFQGGILI